MFQPFLEVLRNRLGVQNFTMQVSSNGELTQIIINPSLSAPAALPDSKGYSEKSQAYRAALTSPIVINAPLDEIDTQLASIVENYCNTLSGVLADSNISSLLKSATDLAAKAVEKDTKKVTQKKSTSTPSETNTDLSSNSDDDDEDDGAISSEGIVNNSGAGGIENDNDILASLGL